MEIDEKDKLDQTFCPQCGEVVTIRNTACDRTKEEWLCPDCNIYFPVDDNILTKIEDLLGWRSLDRLRKLPREQQSLVHAYEILRGIRTSKFNPETYNLVHGAMIYLRANNNFPKDWI